MHDTQEPGTRTAPPAKTFEGFTDEERAALKDRASELRPGRAGRRR